MRDSIGEIARYMRMGRQRPEGALAERIAALEKETAGLVRPASVRRRIPLGPCSPFTRLQAMIDRSRTLRARLDGCHAAFLLCATLGAAIDAFQRRKAVLSGADALIVQAIGAERIEAYADECEDAMRTELAEGEVLVERYSPGYGDFPLDAQVEFFSILDPSRAIGVSLTDTRLMVPSKSVTAIIGVARRDAAEEPR